MIQPHLFLFLLQSTGLTNKNRDNVFFSGGAVDSKEAKVFFLSGSPVIDAMRDKFQLQDAGKTQVAGKRGQNKLYLGKWKDALVLGSTMNISDSYTSNAHRAFLASWIVSQARIQELADTN